MGLGELLGHIHQLQAAQGVALGQEALQDLGDQAALHAVRLDHHKGALVGLRTAWRGSSEGRRAQGGDVLV